VGFVLLGPLAARARRFPSVGLLTVGQLAVVLLFSASFFLSLLAQDSVFFVGGRSLFPISDRGCGQH